MGLAQFSRATATRTWRQLTALVTALTVVACSSGGSGGNGTAPAPPPPNSPPPAPTGWQAGVFQDASTFINQCAAPRSGINPATGAPYPDVQGTTLDENNYLRSMNNDL